MNRTLTILLMTAILIVTSCGSSTSSATTPTTIDPADLPWVVGFRLDDASVGEMVFGPDSDRLFMVGPGPHQARVWDLETRTKKALGIENAGSQIAVNKDGLLAVTRNLGISPTPGSLGVTSNLGVSIWDPQTGKNLHDLDQERSVETRFSPDGSLVVSEGWTANDIHQLTVWDVKTGETLHTLVGHTDSIGEFDFTPDGKTILSTSSDGTVRIWDVETGNQVSLLDHAQNVNSPPRFSSVSPDGKYLVVNHNAGNEAWLWDLEAETVAKKLPASIEMTAFHSFDFSPDGKQLAAGGLGASVLWDVETGEVVQEFPPSDSEAAVNVVFSPDGKYLAISDIANERGIGQYAVIFKQNPK